MADKSFEDNLFEEVRELTRADKGVVDISGYNDIFLANKRFFTATFDYFGSHLKDLSEINPDDYIKRLQNISSNNQATENILYRTIPELKEFAEFIKSDSSDKVKRRLLAMHRSDSNKEILDELEKILKESPDGSISKSVEKFLRSKTYAISKAASGLIGLKYEAENKFDALDTINSIINGGEREIIKALNTVDGVNNLLASASQSLDKEDFAMSLGLIRRLVRRAVIWNNYNDWSDSNSFWNQSHSKEARRFVIDTWFDPVKAHMSQIKRLTSLQGKVTENIISGRPMTLEDARQIIESGGEEEIRWLRGFFRGSNVLIKEDDNTRTANLLDELLSYYHNIKDKDEKKAMGSLFIGPRLDKHGRIFITNDIVESLGSGLAKLDSTFPFSMLHHKDFVYNSATEPVGYMIRAGTKDPVALKLLKSDKEYLGENLTIYGDRIYKDTGEEIVSARSRFTTISTRNGLMKEYLNTVYGGSPQRDFSSESPSLSNTIQKALDIDIHKVKESRHLGTYADIFASFNKKSAEYIDKTIDNIRLIMSAMADNKTVNIDTNTVYETYNTMAGITRFLKFLDYSTEGFSRDTVRKMQKAFLDRGISNDFDARSYRLMQMIEALYDAGSDKTRIDELTRRYASEYGADTLKRLYNSTRLTETLAEYIRDPVLAFNNSTITGDMTRTAHGKHNTIGFSELLIKRLSEELTVELNRSLSPKYSRPNPVSLEPLFEFLESELDTSSAQKARSLAVSTKLLNTLDPSGKALKLDEANFLSSRLEFLENMKSLSENNLPFGNAMKDELRDLWRYFTDQGIDEGEDLRSFYRESFAPRILVSKTRGLKINTKLLIKQVNRGHFDKAALHLGGRIYSFLRQFDAGLDDYKNFTPLSLLGWKVMNRVNDTLNSIDEFEVQGLGLKKTFGLEVRLGLQKGSDLKNASSILKNLTLKRILPVMGALSAIDFLDDVSKSITGTGIYEAGTSGAANLYLGTKKITGALGLDESLKGITQDNAIVQYFSGFTGEEKAEWNSFEEQKKYYEQGYSAVRKARFWTFGSANEFRGGKISYFEPNTLRMLSSDFRNESLYNGEFCTKWNPLRLVDPYYMEKLHSEDRPYPVSGSMFDDFTPYGIVLNYAVGDIIKPKIFLHSDRLSGGIDTKALIYKINRDIRARANGNDNLFLIKSGTLRAVDFVSFDNPTDEGIIDENFAAIDAEADKSYTNPIVVTDSERIGLDTLDRIKISGAKGNVLAKGISKALGSSLSQIKDINTGIRQRAEFNKEEGMALEAKLNNYSDAVDNMLEEAEEIEDVISETSKNDYIHQMAVSARMIGGFYGYMASSAFDFGDNKGKRIATSADMTSISRRFWDSGIGGFGGDVMEIYRRFIPEYRRFQTINPLMNNMPDWLPERFWFGDPYAQSVPMGEARLPGRGYEALNKLHPDAYGMYGAFDRFKILADVAPTSAEYKIWRKIASKTVQDPQLREEMKEIRRRVAMQNRQNDFSPYKYVGRGVERESRYISEILQNGQFKVAGSDATYKLAGVRIKSNETEDSSQVLGRYIVPGQKVTLVTDENEAYRKNRDKAGSINAAVVIDGESIGELMKAKGDAIERKNDISAAPYMARHSSAVNALNYVSEYVAHLDIPIIHNRFLNVNDPLEKYKDDYVYGSSFQSWDTPIDSYIMPAIRKAATSPLLMGIGITSDILYNTSDLEQPGSKFLGKLFRTRIDRNRIAGRYKRFSAGTRALFKKANFYSDRAAMSGSLTGGLVAFGQANRGWTKQVPFRNAFKIGGLGYAAINNTESLPVQLMASARLGYILPDLVLGAKLKRNFVGAGIGTAIGLVRWAGGQNLADWKTKNTAFIPEEVKRRWGIEEYFDRLEYVKYKALFLKAAAKAEEDEGVDIKHILYSQHKEAKAIKKTKTQIKEYLKELSNIDTFEAEEVRAALKKKLLDLAPSKVPVKGGEYTKSAVMYFSAMRSTMFGLDETSQMTDIVRALPKTDREFFMEFVKERDEEKRREILSVASPQIRKALNMLWYKKFDEPEPNEVYFSEHYLPSPLWRGWKPEISLQNVKAKAIKNEAGLVPSDFGIYSSQYSDIEVIEAPELNLRESGDGMLISAVKLEAMLKGAGLLDTEVSVEPRQDSRLEVIANIARIIPYNIDRGMKSLLGF